MENNVQKEESIDLGKLMQIMYNRRKTVGTIVGGCTALALIVSFALPKTYESTTLVQTRSAVETGASSMAAAMGIGGGSNATLSYIELMKSRTVLDPIIDQLEWEDEKKKPKAKDFAKKFLKIENTKQTNLITVTATGKSPEEAQMISQSVVDNFLSMQTDKAKQTQSTFVKFLNERIDEAKQEAQEARTEFAEYQQKHKIYSPDEQARATVSKMNAFDDALGNMAVQQKANQAKLESVSAKLGDMRSSSQAFHINDNANVMALRKQIVDAQVNLVGLRERYTEENPNVISAQEKITALQQKLSEEVNTIVASQYTSINPAQADLIKDQANAEASIAVAQASEAAIKERRAEKEKELENFPQEVLEYLKLQQEASIKEGTYTGLVKQCEDSKIKEAMESMDIQIIDPANLPDENRPVGPKRKLIMGIGFVIGCLLSFVYSLILYKRETSDGGQEKFTYGKV
ncbi:MAG: chain-length determining protein [Selenomonas ruminantium]|uniref:Chain-length determining protein n=1 Tax=Selenomonas ruminantium TaxID=971 RepID=A0A927WMB6_SELRU|nr:chain-length determining protein [Selenomonas ruminantium]